MAQNKPQKAVVATINYAGFEFPGLKLPNGAYAIAVTQVVDLYARDNQGFQFDKIQASRDIKRMLSKNFQFVKSASEINPKKVNILTLEQFGELTFNVAFKGNKIAKAILKASVTTTLEQAFDIAFDNRQKLEQYQAKQQARVQGKLTRRTLTNSIKDYVVANADDLSDNYKKFIYNNCTDAVNRIVFGRSAKKLKESWGCKDIRAAMTIEELMIIDSVERLAIALIDDQGFEPQTAIKEAGNRLLVKQITR